MIHSHYPCNRWNLFTEEKHRRHHQFKCLSQKVSPRPHTHCIRDICGNVRYIINPDKLANTFGWLRLLSYHCKYYSDTERKILCSVKLNTDFLQGNENILSATPMSIKIIIIRTASPFSFSVIKILILCRRSVD